MGQQSSQGGSGADDSMALVWIIILIVITGAIIWAVGHARIVSFIFSINIFQAKIIQFLLGSEHLQQEIYIMQTVDPAAVEWGQLMLLSESVGQYTKYIVITLFVLGIIILYRGNIALKFRRAHNMLTLREQEQHNWPAIMPVMKEKLVDDDINKGPWAMALTPMEFARKYGLLRREDKLLDNPEPGQEMTASIKRGDAKRVFTLQLGPAWDGFEHMPVHARAMAAIFMARINRDKNAASNILESIDKSYALGKPDYSVADAVIKKYEDSKLITKTVNKHAYLLTALASLLELARDDGVVPCAEFLWLKPIDRRLWYMLNCIGRQTPFVEVAGPFAHWKAERLMKRRALVPMVDEAIKAFEIAVKEVKLTPEELQELES